MNEIFMVEALKEAKKSYQIDEIPVGCVIVYKDKIIARGHNCKESKNNSTMHAELIAIDKACKKLKSWRLDDCILYTTLEPCLMCIGAIIESRIKVVYFGTKSYSKQMYANKKLNKLLLYNMENLECSYILSEFFRNKRKK